MAIISRNSSRSFDFGIDRSLLLCVFSLMGIGLVLIYSASFIFATETYGDGLYFFKRQLIFTFLALLGLYCASQVPLYFLRKLFWPLYICLIALLSGTLIPGLAHKAGGANRWINLPGGFHIEPSELTKLMAPLIFAWLMTYEKNEESSPSRFWSMALGIVLLPVILLLGQPDFGSSVIFLLVGLTLLFGFGLPWSYLFSAALLAFPAFYILIMRVDYRRKRMLSFLNPWAEMSGGGFQVVQSLLSFHSGGLWGTGLGKGQSKLYFLPEAHTDFILAVLGEETGFIGLVAVSLLFIWIVLRGLQIAMKAADPFAARLAVGMSVLIGYQAVINMGVVTGLLPTKGLTMPFLSYGGSSLIATCLACGILVRIHKESKWQN